MLGAIDLARRIEGGELTPAAVIDRCAEAIVARDSDINAFVTLALDRAKGTDAGRALPLRGLPFGIKDIFETAELLTCFGSPIYADYRPRADAVLVSQIQRAGGVVLGKTATTEFAYMHPAKTRNPHKLDHTPGGSSSGSAAAVAAGMIPLAIGSQTGGSVSGPPRIVGWPDSNPRMVSYQLLA